MKDFKTNKQTLIAEGGYKNRRKRKTIINKQIKY